MQQIGPYQVLREIGRGGMGVVYLARDDRLGRDVAIKALPEELSQDAGRLERFEREARTLASLSHPNIAAIHGLEEQGGTKYLVLEYVEGETLADRLDRGPLGVDEAVEVAVGIARGLEAAHEAGVVHRDLKPANIKITPGGRVKVLDFGLAKTDSGASSTGSGLSQSPTVTSPVPQHSPTIPGAILGTAAYMSPEQARGRRVDKRTDIWAFGVILYEMLMGASPFIGETATDSLGAVLHKAFEFERLPPQTPPGVRRVLGRCLERDRDLRYHDIADARIELGRPDEVAPGITGDEAGRGRLPWAIVVSLIVAVGAAGWGVGFMGRSPVGLGVKKYDVFAAADPGELDAARPQISPDGKRIAFIHAGQIHVRGLEDFESSPIPGTERAQSVFSSPDSEWIGYLTPGAIHKIDPRRGGAIRLGEAPGRLYEGSGGGWMSDGSIVFGHEADLYRISAGGGPATVVFKGDGGPVYHLHDPTVVPGTTTVLFVEHRTARAYAICALRDGEKTVLLERESEEVVQPAYSTSGHLLFSQGYGDKSVWAVGFDLESLELRGSPFLVVGEAELPSVSTDGKLCVHRGNADQDGELAWVDLEGNVAPLGVRVSEIVIPAVSPDQRWIAYSGGEIDMQHDVWVHDLQRGTNSRLTFFEGMVGPLCWSADGGEVAVLELAPSRDALALTHFYAADGSGPTREPVEGFAIRLDEDGSVVVCVSDIERQLTRVIRYGPDGQEDGQPLELGTQNSFAAISPDGTLLAYAMAAGAEQQVYCTRYPEGTGRWQVSTDGGNSPRWSSDGTKLLYQSPDDATIYSVEVTSEPSVQFGIPRALIDAESLGLSLTSGWNISPDGERIITIKSSEMEGRVSTISVVEDWIAEFTE